MPFFVLSTGLEFEFELFGVGVLYSFFIGNLFLLKLLRIFSLALRNNSVLLRKDLFSIGNLALAIPFN